MSSDVRHFGSSPILAFPPILKFPPSRMDLAVSAPGKALLARVVLLGDTNCDPQRQS